MLLSLHPRFATAILSGAKTVELRRQRVAVAPGTPVVIYATSPVMALLGTARITAVDTATPAQVWNRHRKACGITRAEYRAYMDGASQASALLLDSPRPLAQAVPLSHLRRTGTFHPPQSYRYLDTDALQHLVAGHEAADELLTRVSALQQPARGRSTTSTRPTRTVSAPHSGSSMRSGTLLTTVPAP
ncbi:ASCH domain-containing protein [Streptomyces sp. BF23-18]|uniref:ASCH domain-containing protein n=1 Tax=Streptomyces sp. BF23-18 TaxID=3240282 RepID=UPI0034E484C6